MIWTSIKAKLYIGITLLVSVLFAALKIQSSRLKKSQKKARELGAKNKHATNVREKEQEHEAEFVSRSREIAQEIEETGFTKELSEKDVDW